MVTVVIWKAKSNRDDKMSRLSRCLEKSAFALRVIEESSFLGSDTFVERLSTKLIKRATPKTLKQYERQTNMRDDAIRTSYARGGTV
jgi:hypothetical protein